MVERGRVEMVRRPIVTVCTGLDEMEATRETT